MKKEHIFSKLLFFLLILLIISLNNSCEDDYQPIPYVPVNRTLFLYSDLAALQIGNPLMINGGYGGIIICKIGESNIVAFDRTCTYEPEHSCVVVPDDTGFMAKCMCCGSVYALTTGDVKEGPAIQPLKQYRVTISGDVVHITNY